jgi:hypothetical protein
MDCEYIQTQRNAALDALMGHVVSAPAFARTCKRAAKRWLDDARWRVAELQAEAASEDQAILTHTQYMMHRVWHVRDVYGCIHL